ncbi:MAG: hypothetical protein U0930_06755 [Pirellulales bacterium]
MAALGNAPDPIQRNLAGDPKYAEQLAQMQQLLLSEMRRLDDPFRYSDQPDDDLPKLPKAQPKQPR